MKKIKQLAIKCIFFSIITVFGLELPKEGKNHSFEELDLNMTWIKAGEYELYVDDEKRLVNIESYFWIGTYEVTQKQWEFAGMENLSYFKHENNPVDYVSYVDAKEFCKKLTSKFQSLGLIDESYSFALPSTNQWAVACLSMQNEGYKFDLTTCEANFDGTYPLADTNSKRFLNGTVPVGRYPANDLGIYDLYGNVWEWCETTSIDYYDSNYDNQNIVNLRSEQGIVKGGGWLSPVWACHPFFEMYYSKNSRFQDRGMRLILQIDSPSSK